LPYVFDLVVMPEGRTQDIEDVVDALSRTARRRDAVKNLSVAWHAADAPAPAPAGYRCRPRSFS
jgi:hypothetical protein